MIPRKCHTQEIHTSRGTKGRRDEEQTRTAQKPHIKPQTQKQRRTATEEPPCNNHYCVSQVINSRALTGEKPCINKAIHALLMHGYAPFNMIVPRPHICYCYEFCTPGPRTSIVRGNCVRETSVKRRNKIVQEITRNVANVFSFYAIIAIEHGFSMH